MKEYKITYYDDETQKSFIVTAESKDEALQKAWSIVDSESVYVSEVEK